MPVHIIVEPELAEMHTLSCWPIQDPASKLILGEIPIRAQWSAACRRSPSGSCGAQQASASVAPMARAIVIHKPARRSAVTSARSMMINLAEKRRTPNVARKTSNQNRVPAIPDNNNRLTAPLDVERWTLDVGRFLYQCFSAVSSRT